MDASTIQKDIITFVCKNFLVTETDFDAEQSLIDQGIIDSFGLVEISAHLKKTYAITIVAEELNRANFGSIPQMAAFVERKFHG